MTVNIPLGLIFQTILTGVIGWLVKVVLDTLKTNHDETLKWQKDVNKRLDNMGGGIQATMRTQIVHYCEKYFTREWLTSEELASLLDMHEKYKAVIDEPNGFIDSYILRVKELPIREVV